MKINCLKSVAHVAFFLNLITKSELESWAYDMIENDNYNDFFLSLTTCKNDKDVLDTFGEIPSNLKDTQFFIEYFLGFFKYSFKNQTWQLTEEKLVSFYRIIDFYQVDDAVKLFLIRLKDDYELRREGFGGSMDMPLDLISFLDQFYKFPEYKVEFDKINFPKLHLLK